MAERISDVFRDTEIWKHFQNISAPDKVTMVNELVEYAIPILDRIIETFPTYTLHNGQHQLNILNLYGKLLGTRLQELSSLESAILILAAFYHDIGMVFSEEERTQLSHEKEFEEFLNTYPKAQLMYHENNGIDNELAEWYCRSRHADRVWVYLNSISDKLYWGKLSLREALAKVCLSHNQGVHYIKSDELSSNFWRKADLKHCAILLRLADILDFDNSRSPESVFEYLKLDLAKTGGKKISYDEWSKHLDSEGFLWENWKQVNNYELGFLASPKNPAVQNDINEFLNTIENEFARCSQIFRFCSKKWQNFKIPEKISRENILSNGFTFGDFKFKLDKYQILNLLMGENLYDDPSVFIRELLQNAIDTTNHRIFHELNIGVKDYQPDPIQISDWEDSDGYRWLRIDDFGMGMDLNQVSNYFLNIGNSYYNSDEFRVKKLMYEKSINSDFTPVSRFGIGILSCFMIGDIVEVSTMPIEPTQEPIRLILKGMQSYFLLYTKNDIPSDMPGPAPEKGFRHKAGTSVSVRIQSNYNTLDLDFSEKLKALVHNPPVSIFFNKTSLIEPINYFQECQDECFTLDSHKKNIALELLKHTTPSVSDIRIKLFKTVIGLSNIDKSIDGVLTIINVKTYSKTITEKDFKPNKRLFQHCSLQLTSEGKFALFLQSKRDKKSKKSERQFINLDDILQDHFHHRPQTDNTPVKSSIGLAHNSIVIPNDRLDGESVIIKITMDNSTSSYCYGHLGLYNDLRPELNVSRDRIVKLNWQIFSRLNYLIYTILKKSSFQYRPYHDVLYYFTNRLHYVPKEANQDPFIIQKNRWPQHLGLNLLEANKLKIIEFNRNWRVIRPVYRSSTNNRQLLAKHVYHQHLEIEIEIVSNESDDIKKGHFELKYFARKRESVNHIDLNNITPFTFCFYRNFDGFTPFVGRIRNYGNDFVPLNANHQYSKWILKNYETLEMRYSNHLKGILYASNKAELIASSNKLYKIMPSDQKPNYILTQKDFQIHQNEVPKTEDNKP